MIVNLKVRKETMQCTKRYYVLMALYAHLNFAMVKCLMWMK